MLVVQLLDHQHRLTGAPPQTFGAGDDGQIAHHAGSSIREETVVDTIAASIAPGEFFSLLGPSGRFMQFGC